MRSYEKILLVPILAALALIVAAALDYPTRSAAHGSRSADPAGRAAADNGHASDARSREAGAVANDQDRRAQDPRVGDASSNLLCSPETALSRVVDPGTRTAVAADEAGHLAFYGGAGGAGALTDGSYEILSGCLPQLAYTNHATVLVEGRGPEAAGPDTVRSKTRRTADDELVTSFAFAGGVHLDQRLSLQDGALRADYTLTNDATERTSVSLRALVTPTADLGPSRDGRVARFVVDPGDGRHRRPVESETEIDGAAVGAVRVPRTGVPSDSSGRLLFAGEGEGRRPDLVAFASTLDLSAARFRHAPAERPSPWPLPPASSMAVYWLYEDIPAAGPPPSPTATNPSPSKAPAELRAVPEPVIESPPGTGSRRDESPPPPPDVPRLAELHARLLLVDRCAAGLARAGASDAPSTRRLARMRQRLLLSMRAAGLPENRWYRLGRRGLFLQRADDLSDDTRGAYRLHDAPWRAVRFAPAGEPQGHTLGRARGVQPRTVARRVFAALASPLRFGPPTPAKGAGLLDPDAPVDKGGAGE